MAGGPKSLISLSLSVEGVPVVSRTLSLSRAAVRDLRPAWQDIAEDFWKGEAAVFRRQGAVEGYSRWQALSPTYKDRKVARGYSSKILIASGALMASVTRPNALGSVFVAKKQSFRIGTKIPYAIYHQSRRPRRMGSDGKPILPRRDFIRVTERQKKRWVKYIQAFVARTVKQSKTSTTTFGSLWGRFRRVL